MYLIKISGILLALAVVCLAGCRKSRVTDHGTARLYEQTLHTVLFSESKQHEAVRDHWENFESFFPQLWIQTGQSFFRPNGKLDRAKSSRDSWEKLQPVYLVGTWMNEDQIPNSPAGIIHFIEKARQDSLNQFAAYVFGKKDRKVKFIFLDSESFVNEKPWDWIEDQLSGEEALQVICSDLKMNNEYKNTLNAILERSKAKNIVHVTGNMLKEGIDMVKSPSGKMIYRMSVCDPNTLELGVLRMLWKTQQYELMLLDTAGKKIAYQKISL
ncbi:MAG: hypothetical protein MI784_01435 [Cytophagales bacterium]|nr:hypothetical protein [Cytophagales bacterium]